MIGKMSQGIFLDFRIMVLESVICFVVSMLSTNHYHKFDILWMTQWGVLYFTVYNHIEIKVIISEVPYF